jgi:hypothetical protein
MAEAASLALAAWIISLLRMEDITFLTDSQLLVNFFNGLGFSSTLGRKAVHSKIFKRGGQH